MSTAKDFKLCYVEDGRAFFTDQSFDMICGDDWDDRPYEHNAGHPYHPTHLDTETWVIKTLVIQGDLEEPKHEHLNSSYSVYDINKKKVPWLKSSQFSSAPPVKIWAGTDMDEFCELVRKSNNKVFFPMDDIIDFQLALKYGNFDNLRLVEALENVRSGQ